MNKSSRTDDQVEGESRRSERRVAVGETPRVCKPPRIRVLLSLLSHVLLSTLLLLPSCGRDGDSGSEGPERLDGRTRQQSGQTADGSAGASSAAGLTRMKPERVVGIARIEPELRIAELSSEVTGTVRSIDAPVGSALRSGAPILHLTDEVEQARVAQAESRIQVAQAQIQSSEAALNGARAREVNAGRIFSRTDSLAALSLEPQAGLDQAQADYESAQAEVNRLKADLAAARASLQAAQADLQDARAELNRRTVRAPADGRLLSMDVTLGDPVTAGTPFATFAPESPLSAWCEVDELFAHWVQTGQRAFVRYPGAVDTLATGTVSFAGPYLRRKSLFSDDVGDLEDRRVREVRVLLGPGDSLLLGSRVECVIETP